MSKINGTKLFIFLASAGILLNFTLINSAQDFKNGTFFWNWTTKPKQDNFQLNFQLSLKVKGKNASGALVFSNLIGGEWDETDRNLTPFTGKISGTTILIEFDAKDTRNYEEYDSPFDAAYRKPKRNSASRATLKITKDRLEFVLTNGKSLFDLPGKIIMRRVV